MKTINPVVSNPVSNPVSNHELTRNLNELSLKELSGDELIMNLKSLVAQEKKLGLEILEHLQEVSDRRLHLKLGFSSLFDYATRELGYSEAHAFRLSSAVRVVRELPEMKEKLEEGALTLTHLSQAACFFKKEAITEQHEKKEILEKLEHRSKRETERLLISLSPNSAEMMKPEKIRAVSDEFTEIRMTIDSKMLHKLEKLKGLLSHQLSNPNSMSEVFEKITDLAIERLEPKSKVRSKSKSNKAKSKGKSKSQSALVSKSESKSSRIEEDESQEEQASQGVDPEREKELVAQIEPKNPLPPGEVKKQLTSSRYIPKEVKARIWQRAQGQCEYEYGGTRCSSQRFLQIDHVTPYAKGGDTSFENLRLLCQGHNAYSAIQEYGQRKMRRYLGE